MNSFQLIYLLPLLVLLSPDLHAQSTDTMDPISPIESVEIPESIQTADPVMIPNNYRSITLGMSMHNVREKLIENSWFSYKGEDPVSLTDKPQESLIVTDGTYYISRGLFQFKDDTLIAIILELSPDKLDWFTVYTSLEKQYGTPATLDPYKAWWEDDNTRLALERPLTVKYLDTDIYGKIQNNLTPDWREDARNEFLNAF